MLLRISSFSFLLGLLPVAAIGAQRPIVVELFTSQGCSSCPPADAFLTDLARQRHDVLPLAFHVTYWNSLGWADPFSIEAATQRQSQYGARFGDGSFTPEMVVDGERGLVGSDRDRAEAVIAAAVQQNRTAASVSLSRQGEKVSISIGAGNGSGRIVLIGFDPEHRTAVGRGENSGRTLLESNIVRSIHPVGQWTGAAMNLDESFPAGQDAAVLLEAPDGKIIGASRLRPSP
jgi:hypothetical protein